MVSCFPCTVGWQNHSDLWVFHPTTQGKSDTMYCHHFWVGIEDRWHGSYSIEKPIVGKHMMILRQWILHIEMHVEWKKRVVKGMVVWEKMLRRLINNMKINVHNGNSFDFFYDVRNIEIRNIVVTYTKLTWHEFNIVIETNCYTVKNWDVQQ